MQTERVSVEIAGRRVSGWNVANVRASIKEACRSVSLQAVASMGPDATIAMFRLFAEIRVFAGSDLLFTGHIDRRRSHYDASAAYFSIEGRTKGADAVDCSCVHKTGRFENRSPLEIAQALDQFKIGWKSDTKLNKIKEVQLQPGETLFRAIERLTRDDGATLAGQADGSILITRAGKTAKRQPGALIEGLNIEIGDSEFDGSNRHSKVIARGQSYDGHGDEALRIEAEAEDGAVPRYRPLIHVQDANTDKERLQTRARNRVAKSVGESVRAVIATAGWRDETGALWEAGRKVWVESRFLGLAQDMLIETIDYAQDKSSTSATLSLVDPRAHGGDADKSGKPSRVGKASGSSAEWSTEKAIRAVAE